MDGRVSTAGNRGNQNLNPPWHEISHTIISLAMRTLSGNGWLPIGRFHPESNCWGAALRALTAVV